MSIDTANIEAARAAAEVRDLRGIIAFWPTEEFRDNAREMIADDDHLWRRIGRQYLAYVDSFEQTWSERKDFI